MSQWRCVHQNHALYMSLRLRACQTVSWPSTMSSWGHAIRNMVCMLCHSPGQHHSSAFRICSCYHVFRGDDHAATRGDCNDGNGRSRHYCRAGRICLRDDSGWRHGRRHDSLTFRVCRGKRHGHTRLGCRLKCIGRCEYNAAAADRRGRHDGYQNARLGDCRWN